MITIAIKKTIVDVKMPKIMLSTVKSTDQEFMQTPAESSISKEYASLEEFFKSVERRAFHMAKMATSNSDDALDIIQDSMFKMVNNYADKKPEEWRPLFYRILNNKITDFYRRKSVRDRIFHWTSWTRSDTDESAFDYIENAEARSSETPDELAMRQLRIDKLSIAVKNLPTRQREAFMLRCWDGMSTAETAQSMRCSEGSVKTHYSRALNTLRGLLEDYWHE